MLTYCTPLQFVQINVQKVVHTYWGPWLYENTLDLLLRNCGTHYLKIFHTSLKINSLQVATNVKRNGQIIAIYRLYSTHIHIYIHDVKLIIIHEFKHGVVSPRWSMRKCSYLYTILKVPHPTRGSPKQWSFTIVFCFPLNIITT